MVGQTFNSINVTCHSRVLFLILSITWSVKGTLKTRPTDIVWSQQKYCSVDKLMFLELKLPVYIMILFKLIMMPWSLWLLKEKHNYHLPFACGWCKVRGVVFDLIKPKFINLHNSCQFKSLASWDCVTHRLKFLPKQHLSCLFLFITQLHDPLFDHRHLQCFKDQTRSIDTILTAAFCCYK